MTRAAGLLIVALASSAGLFAQRAPDVVLTQTPFEVHSAFWVNLHHVLLAESVAREGRGAQAAGRSGALTNDERRTWDEAVRYYAEEMADLHPLFEMGPIRKALIAATGDLPASGLTADHRRVLSAAAPVYRKYWWADDNRANRAWAADAMAKVASLTPAVPDRLASLFGTPWFTSTVRVDVVPIASREGAFTSIDPAPAHVTISSSSPVIRDWTAAEVLFHESSHALARPILQGFAAEAKAQGKDARDVWHAVLFFMTGEVVREALAARGITYEPYLYKTGLFDRAWPAFKPLIETHWRAYLKGEISRDEAIKRIVSGIK